MTCWKTLLSELHPRKFLLEYENPHHFGTPQVQCGPWSMVYIIYRSLVLAFFTCVLVYDLAVNSTDTEFLTTYLTFLTNWTYIVFILHLALLFGISVRHYNGCKLFAALNPYQTMPSIYKICWICFNIVNVMAPAVTMCFWAFLFSAGVIGDMAEQELAEHKISTYTIVFHGANSVVTIADIFISAIPVRLLHFWFAQMFFIAYTLFSLVHWSLTNDPVYNAADWGKTPGLGVLVTASVTIVLIPIVHTFNFLFYKLRMVIFEDMTCCGAPPQDSSNRERTVTMEKQGDVEKSTICCVEDYGVSAEEEKQKFDLEV